MSQEIIVARKTAARPAATDAAESRTPLDAEWPDQLDRVLKAAQVRKVSYVPDAGHSALIRLFAADGEVKSNVLTTEEEGIAIATGAWLGGSRSVLLLQSSGVGNCVNMLSLVTMTRTPLLMLVTMRGGPSSIPGRCRWDLRRRRCSPPWASASCAPTRRVT
jgi:hypothetical protein